MTNVPDEDNLNEESPPESGEENGDGVATPYVPKRPRNLLVMLALVFVIVAAIAGGIIAAVMSSAEDPMTIEMPSHTTKSLADEHPLSDSTPVDVMEETSTVPEPMADAPVDAQPQTEVPLDINGQTTVPQFDEEQTEKPLLNKNPVAPQSMIQWHPAAREVAAAVPQPVRVTGSPKIVIVIDDMGLNIPNSRRAVALPAPVTLAYLPYAQSLPQQTRAAWEQGHELIVHMPMEPDNLKGNNPGPDALLSTLPSDENVNRLRRNLQHFDAYIGINNHMGSRMTASAAQMRPLMRVLKEKSLWFLDSRTIGHSVAGKVAGEEGVPYAERDVFLDNVATVGAVMAQLRQTEAIAQRKGYAIAIGHPHDATIAALQSWLPQAQEKGFRIVPLSTIIAARFPSADLPRYARSKKNGNHDIRHAAAKSSISSN